VIVRVYDPESVPKGLLSFTAFRVVLIGPQGHQHEGVHKTRRRYSDFELLAKSLASRYEGMILPKLPSKFRFAQHTEEFLETRMRCLTLWAEKVARTTPLLHDIVCASFFGLRAEPWDVAMQRLNANEYARHNNPGIDKWHERLARVTIPEDDEAVEARAECADKELARAVDALVSLEKHVDAFVTTATAHATAMRALEVSMGSWGAVERCEMQALTKGNRTSGSAKLLGNVLRGWSDFHALESKITSAHPALLRHLLLLPLQSERLVLEAAQDQLKLRDARKTAYAAARARAEKVSHQLGAIKAPVGLSLVGLVREQGGH